MGPSVAEVNGVDDQKLANGEDTNKGKENGIKSDDLISKDVGGCCQGVNGVSCCRIEQSNGIEGSTEKSKISSNWSGLKERDILIGVGVLGAVAAVAVAFKIYKRSG